MAAYELEEGGVNPTGIHDTCGCALDAFGAELGRVGRGVVRIATFHFVTAEHGIALKASLPCIENKL